MPDRLYHYRLTLVVSNTLLRNRGWRAGLVGFSRAIFQPQDFPGVITAVKDLPGASPPSRISLGLHVFEDPPVSLII